MRLVPTRLVWSAPLVFSLAFAAIPPSAAAQQNSADAPRKLVNMAPLEYPELARRMNIRGTVKLEVVIAPSGTVKKARVIGGNPVLVGAAEDSIRKWKYEPAPHDSSTVVELHFNPK
jgi:TonB family protein